MNSAEAQIVVTGLGWMGHGIRSIDAVLEELFLSAREEILVTAYSIGTGAEPLFMWTERALERGVAIIFIMNSIRKHPLPVIDRINLLIKTYKHLQVFDFTSDSGTALHAKAIVVDRERALIGSSNLSRNGLIINYELSALISGSAARLAANSILSLLSQRDVSAHRADDDGDIL